MTITALEEYSALLKRQKPTDLDDREQFLDDAVGYFSLSVVDDDTEFLFNWFIAKYDETGATHRFFIHMA